MKKLLIAMTAVAVGTCAWATEGADGESTEPTTPTVTYLDESFSENWTLAGNAFWSYTGTEETELAITNVAAADAAADYELALNTGSKVLTGSFASDKKPVAIGTEGLYFKSTVTFQDPSDTLPTLGAQDKFALVVLDNVDSLPSETDSGRATNLWVIAKYGPDFVDDVPVSRAYKLKIPAVGGTIDNIPASWFDDAKRIEIKAYNNVMAADQTARAGFVVAVDDVLCIVDYSCPIVNNVIDLSTKDYPDSEDYLGFSPAQLSNLGKNLEKEARLLISRIDNNATLASVDFQGQGIIDDVKLTTAPTADFDDDGVSLTFANYNATGIASINPSLTDGAYDITGKAKDEVLTFIVTLTSSDYMLKATGATVTGSGTSYTLTYTVTDDKDQSITLNVFQPVAWDKNGIGYETFSEALSAGGEITLAQNLTLDQKVTVSENTTIDLKGYKIATTSSPMFALAQGVSLTIKDTGANGVLEVKNGGTYGAVADFAARVTAASVYIEGGIINAKVETKDGLTYTIKGGKFLRAANETLAGVDTTKYAATDDGNGYWVVAPVSTSDYPESDKLVVSDTALTDDEKAAVKATFDDIAGESADKDAAVKSYINTVYGDSVPATALIGANNVDISVKFSLPLMKENPVVKFVAEAAEAGEAAAFTFQIKEGDAGDAVAIKAALAKVYEMIRYSTDLNGLDAGVVEANNGNVECTISADMKSVKVSFKSGEDKPSKGFMKVKLR